RDIFWMIIPLPPFFAIPSRIYTQSVLKLRQMSAIQGLRYTRASGEGGPMRRSPGLSAGSGRILALEMPRRRCLQAGERHPEQIPGSRLSPPADHQREQSGKRGNESDSDSDIKETPVDYKRHDSPYHDAKRDELPERIALLYGQYRPDDAQGTARDCHHVIHGDQA